jgi:hypothetical protein
MRVLKKEVAGSLMTSIVAMNSSINDVFERIEEIEDLVLMEGDTGPMNTRRTYCNFDSNADSTGRGPRGSRDLP